MQSATDERKRPVSSASSSLEADVTMTSAWQEFAALSSDSEDDDVEDDEIDGRLDVDVVDGAKPKRKRYGAAQRCFSLML